MAATVQSNFVPTIWASRFVTRLMEALVWGQLVNRNYEGTIAMAGDTVKIPVPSTAITVRDYVADNDIAAAELASGTSVDLSIDKQKYTHLFVDSIDRAQSAPDVMDDAMRWSAYAMALQIDQDIRAEVGNAFTAGRRVEDVDQALTDDAFVPAFIKALAKASRVLDEANIRGPSWIVVTPGVVEALTVYFATKTGANTALFAPATTEQALRNGFSGTLLGYSLYVSNQVPQGGPSAAPTQAGEAASRRLWLGRGNESVTFANQITETVAYNPEKRFGDAIKMLLVYGVKTVLPGAVALHRRQGVGLTGTADA